MKTIKLKIKSFLHDLKLMLKYLAMKTLVVISMIFLAYNIQAQTVEQLKTYVDSQKTTVNEKVGEKWQPIYSDSTYYRAKAGDSIWYSQESQDLSLKGKALKNSWSKNDTVYVPQITRHSFQEEWLYNGVVIYKQKIGIYANVVKQKPQKEQLIDWLKYAKTNDIKSNNVILIGDYILGKNQPVIQQDSIIKEIKK